MIDYDLQRALARISRLAATADNSSEDNMFDSLAEIALASQNAVSDHSVTRLLRAGEYPAN